MKLSHFSLALSLILLALSTLTAALLYYIIYLPSISSELIDQQQNELSSLQTGLLFSQRNLSTLCYDYSLWDDMVEFIQRPSSEFIESNLYPNAFLAANIDFAAVYDNHGHKLWHYVSNKIDVVPESLTIGEWRGKVLPSDAEIEAKVPSSRSGFMILENKVVFYSNTTVIPSVGHGDIAGSLLMLRVIDVPILAEVAKLTLVRFTLVPEQLINTPLNFPILTADTKITQLASNHSWFMPDVFGQNIVLTLWHTKSSAPSVFSLGAIIVLIPLLLLSFGSVLPLLFFVLKPLIAANHVIEKMAKRGVLLKLRQRFFIDELNRLSGSFNLLMDRLEHHQNYLESLSMQDPLTGIANRRGLESFAQRAYEDWRDGKGTIGFLMIDVDCFKSYNDTFGHALGDKALLRVAQALLVECKRRGELVTRYGGEEFCVVIHGDNIEQMEALAQRMLLKVQELDITHSNGVYKNMLTVSIGGAFFERFDETTDDIGWRAMIELADKHLYHAKEKGRNRVSLSCVDGRVLRIVP